LISFALVYWRLPGLAAANRLDSFFSRESAFLMNNLLLVGIAFAVFWGTVFPLLSQAVRGPAGKVTVGAPFFNRVTGPLFLLLLLFMAAGPLLSWRKASPENLRRNLLRPLAAAGLAGSTLLKADSQATVRLGQSIAVGDYRATPVRVEAGTVPNVGPSWTATVRITKDGHHVATMKPRLILFEQNPLQGQQPVGVIALRSTPLQDIYVTLVEPSTDLKSV